MGNYSMPRYFQNMPVVGKPVKANAENATELRAIEDDIHAHVVKALEEKGYTFASAQIEMVPQTFVTLTEEGDLKTMQKLIDFLEDNDDVQNVWHNAELPEEDDED